MGTLRKYELSNSQCKIFFETGTGLGHSLQHALDVKAGFHKLYSVEIHEETAKRAIKRFEAIKNIQIINSDSINAIKKILSCIPAHTPILFFLDAHFPGEVESDYDYKSNNVNEITMPLEEELRLINSLRPNSDDVIIVDDWRLYEKGNYENDNCDDNFANITDEFRNINFLTEIFSNRVLERCCYDDGYLIIKPKSSPFKMKKVSTIYKVKRSLKRCINKFLEKF